MHRDEVQKWDGQQGFSVSSKRYIFPDELIKMKILSLSLVRYPIHYASWQLIPIQRKKEDVFSINVIGNVSVVR